MELLYWILPLLHCIYVSAGSGCQFPEEWRGRWHQGRRTEISINSISRKGTCVQKHGNNKYFMLNKDSSNRKCFKCLVFTQWHPNLLQYKESPCWYEESFHHVCGLINGDATLHTLVRVPSIPQPCPFQGSYTFSYINGSMSNKCDSPISEVRACADESKFKFIFKRCPGIPGTYDNEMDFQCLATWENGDKYLYGSFSKPWMMSADEHKYRCFMHSFYGTSGDMSMSADPTCQGLQSPTLGVISMNFHKDMNEPRGTCQFPDVLVNQNKWRDLSGKWQLEVEAGLQTLRLKERQARDVIRYREASTLERSSTKLVINCVERTYQAESFGSDILQTEYLTYVTNDTCESGYQCVRLIKRDENVLEMYLGDTVESNEVKCKEHHFAFATKHILIPDVNDAGLCSVTRKGIYTYQDKASSCSGKVNIGCQTQNEIIIETTCPNQSAKLKKVDILNCIHSWTTDSKTYIITQKPGQAAKCLMFVDTEIGIELQSDDSCQSDRWTVTSRYLNYLLYNPPEPCFDREYQADQNVGGSPVGLTNKDIFTKDKYPSSGCYRTSNSVFLIISAILVYIVFRHR